MKQVDLSKATLLGDTQPKLFVPEQRAPAGYCKLRLHGSGETLMQCMAFVVALEGVADSESTLVHTTTSPKPLHVEGTVHDIAAKFRGAGLQ